MKTVSITQSHLEAVRSPEDCENVKLDKISSFNAIRRVKYLSPYVWTWAG